MSNTKFSLRINDGAISLYYGKLWTATLRCRPKDPALVAKRIAKALKGGATLNPKHWARPNRKWSHVSIKQRVNAIFGF